MSRDRSATAALSAPFETVDGRLARGGIFALRAGVALLWIQNVAWKVPPDFGERENTGLYLFTRFAVDYPVFPPFTWFIEQIVLPAFPLFGWMTLLVEAGLGAFLLIGLATRFWAVVGVVQSLAITLSVLNAPNEWHWAYYLMILAHTAIFATAAGRAYGVDGVLRPRWVESTGRFEKLLARLS
ncbi:DoxX family protein [Pseudarthrobacter sp. O4]|uniref:DoxX family protein n=1 Tax=Pseudarthrobacter sp. O4 TaxID=3418417 RepID=UPI003CFAC68C